MQGRPPVGMAKDNFRTAVIYRIKSKYCEICDSSVSVAEDLSLQGCHATSTVSHRRFEASL
jgi:hypothetical protein